jgi:bifunctional DNA-binding transcriptional regulator/antitoxin component of YhaV-PrlF toxin-antitoxin module
LSADGKIALPEQLRQDAHLNPGDKLEVQLYKGTIVLRKHEPLSPEQCRALLEQSRSQPMTLSSKRSSNSRATPGDDLVVLDTNIVASATYWRGKPAHCLEA